MDSFVLTVEIQVRLKELASELKNAKAAEALARNSRIDAEEQIAALIPTEDTGQKTVTLNNGTKITVKRELNYKADVNKLYDEMVCECPQHIPPVKTKTTKELDAKGYEWYRTNEPKVYELISQYVTVTPKKVAVTLVVK